MSRTLQRETKGEVVFVSPLGTVLERLNPALPPEAISTAVRENDKRRFSMDELTALMNSHFELRTSPGRLAPFEARRLTDFDSPCLIPLL